MSENTTNNKSGKDDEIDLFDLFRRMGRTLNNWSHALGKGFLISLVFILKRWILLALSVALGIGISYFMKMTSESFYTSDLVLRNNAYVYHTKKDPAKPALISVSDLVSHVNRLQLFCKQKNTAAFAEAISSSNDQIINILDISAFWVIDKGADGIPDYIDYSNSQNVYDTVNVRMKDRFDIRVRIKTPQDLSKVRDGILRYINSDSLIKQRNRLRIRQYNELVARYSYDIKQLDSLQKVKYFEESRNVLPRGGGQMVFLQEQKTQLLYTDIQNLYDKKQNLETDLNLYKDAVTVLSDFTLPANRDNGALYYGKYIIPVTVLITLLLLIMMANRRKLKEIYKKYS
jgi:hypothetical protein